MYVLYHTDYDNQALAISGELKALKKQANSGLYIYIVILKSL